MAKDQKFPGGLLVGETDKNGGKGIKVIAPEGNILMGGGETVIVSDAGKAQDKYEFEGEQKTPCEILSDINVKYKGVKIPCQIAEPANTTDSKMEVGDVIRKEAGGNISNDNLTELKNALSKYGWTAKISEDGKYYQLINRNGKIVSDVKFRGSRYFFFDMPGNKLMSGMGELGKSAERLAKEYFYANTTAAIGISIPSESNEDKLDRLKKDLLALEVRGEGNSQQAKTIKEKILSLNKQHRESMASGGITKDEKEVLKQAKNIWIEKRDEAEQELRNPDISNEDMKRYEGLLKEANQHLASFDNGSMAKGGKANSISKTYYRLFGGLLADKSIFAPFVKEKLMSWTDDKELAQKRFDEAGLSYFDKGELAEYEDDEDYALLFELHKVDISGKEHSNMLINTSFDKEGWINEYYMEHGDIVQEKAIDLKGKPISKERLKTLLYAKGGRLEDAKLKYAKKDINLLEKEHNIAITDTEFGVLWGSHKDGIFEFNTSNGTNIFKGGKADAIEFVKNAFTIEQMENGGNVKGIPVLKKDATWKDVKGYLVWLGQSPYAYHIDDDPKDVFDDKEVIDVLSNNSDIMWKFSTDGSKGTRLWQIYYLATGGDKGIQERLGMAKGGSVKTEELSDMLWILRKDGPSRFYNQNNVAIAEELVNRGLAEKIGDKSNEYAITKKGEMELMASGGKVEEKYHIKKRPDGSFGIYNERGLMLTSRFSKEEAQNYLDKANNTKEYEIYNQYPVKKSKYDIGDMVYSWQNKDYPAEVVRRNFSSWESIDKLHENDKWQYLVKLKNGQRSKWMSEPYLFKTKQRQYSDGGKTQLQIGIEVEKEHKDLYKRVKKMFERNGMRMPISEKEFYKTIAKAHIKEDKYYYDKLLKYVEGEKQN